MGIPFFFYWLRNNFSDCIYRLKPKQTFRDIVISYENKTSPRIDNLAIDLNGVFHYCAQKIYKYGSFKEPQRFLRKQPPKATLAKQLEMFKEVCNQISILVNITNPRKRLILCVDGVAGSAKQCQQRGRRFKSAKLQEQEDTNFNSNVLSPGTKFMDYLTKYIDFYIREQISNGSWRHLDVVFSNEKAPGEGEAKIISFIRYYGGKDESYCIHGLDADLIMLSLGTHVKDFYILREDTYNDGDHLVINIGKYRKDLAEYMNWGPGKKYSSYTAINDFIFICFLIGNDFLPHIPTLEIFEGGIEKLLDVYKSVCSEYGHLTRKYNESIVFHKKSLEIFLGTIAQYEKGSIEDKLNKTENIFPDELLNRYITTTEEGVIVDLENYKKAYYEEKLNVSKQGESIKEICHKYLEGMQWVLSYYTKGMPNWRWFYPHHYAPFTEELAHHLKTFRFPVYGRTTPITPFQQLLSILPPAHADLIPTPLNKLLEPDSPIAHYYPEDFDVDLGGKRKEWEGIVLLPMVDVDKVRKAYFSKVTQVDNNELKRNILGKSFVYRFDPNARTKEFKSFYGVIPRMKVRTEIIEL
jgi:5'-3' exonuclease